MDHFQYQNGQLCAEDVPLMDIANSVGTPLYCYSTATLERHYHAFADAFADMNALICYAVKANSNTAVIGTLAGLGAGADVVSGGELKRALAAGIPPQKIVFSGVGKTEDELAAALKAGVKCINIESDPELETLNKVAVSLGVAAACAIRVNPDVDANTHEKISTGKSENKFGIDLARAHKVFTRTSTMAAISLTGIAVHIGSQITDLKPFEESFAKVRNLVATLRAHNHVIDSIDVGGGLGVPYVDAEKMAPSPADYAKTVKETLSDLKCELIIEPGRAIAGNAGVLVMRVIYVKEGASRTFAIVDAAMNDLLRPALYGAQHTIIPVMEPPTNANWQEVDVVGPVCETGDTFAKQMLLPEIKPGDLLVIRTAGAYASVMGSFYNSRPLAPETIVKGNAFHVVRKRISVDDLMAWETTPPWLDSNR